MGGDEPSELVRVAERFAGIARTLAAHADPQRTLDDIVRLAVDNLQGCEFAGISLVRGRQVSTTASSNDLPRTVDAIQYEENQGPCLDAIREHEVFCTGDVVADGRWPRFARRANDATGVRSIMAIRLFVEEDTMGALNLYSQEQDAFDRTDVSLGSVFAAHAALAMASGRREANLEAQIRSRDLIGQAKGILMAHTGVDDAGAFDLLRRASQRLNQKLTVVAKDVVDRSRPVPGDR